MKKTPHTHHLLHPSILRARKLANLLDSAFTIPVIRKKIGLDPILGLVPGGGDLITALLSLYPLYVAYEMGMPRHLMARMGVNILMDFAVGSVPVVGDVVDIFWKANRKNLDLLEKAYIHHHLQHQDNVPDGPVVTVEAEVVK